MKDGREKWKSQKERWRKKTAKWSWSGSIKEEINYLEFTCHRKSMLLRLQSRNEIVPELDAERLAYSREEGFYSFGCEVGAFISNPPPPQVLHAMKLEDPTGPLPVLQLLTALVLTSLPCTQLLPLNPQHYTNLPQRVMEMQSPTGRTHLQARWIGKAG